MRYVDPATVRRLAPLRQLVRVLEVALRADYVTPLRQVVELPNRADGGLFVSMPRFDTSGSGAVKLAPVCPAPGAA